MAVFNPIAELRFQAQWKEMERKNQKIRMKWFHKNYEKVYKNPSLPEDKIPKKAAVLYNELIKMRQERMSGEKKERSKLTRKGDLAYEPVYEEDKEIDIGELLDRGPMYPVPEEVRETLYHGISHNDEGRRHYLKLRNKLAPEDKFFEPVTGTQIYGWKVAERMIPFKRYGRRAVIKDSFLRRNGPLKYDSLFWRPPFSDAPGSSLPAMLT